MFNTSLVESDLLEIIGLYVSSKIIVEEEKVFEINIGERNTHEEKQKYFEVARAPVLLLYLHLFIFNKTTHKCGMRKKLKKFLKYTIYPIYISCTSNTIFLLFIWPFYFLHFIFFCFNKFKII